MDGFATPYGGRPGFTGTGTNIAPPSYNLPSAYPSSTSMEIGIPSSSYLGTGMKVSTLFSLIFFNIVRFLFDYC